MAIAPADDFPNLSARAPEFPALFHFSCGVEKDYAYGVDDCLGLLTEFIANNKRQ
jgi:hypothetical protein